MSNVMIYLSAPGAVCELGSDAYFVMAKNDQKWRCASTARGQAGVDFYPGEGMTVTYVLSTEFKLL